MECDLERVLANPTDARQFGGRHAMTLVLSGEDKPWLSSQPLVPAIVDSGFFHTVFVEGKDRVSDTRDRRVYPDADGDTRFETYPMTMHMSYMRGREQAFLGAARAASADFDAKRGVLAAWSGRTDAGASGDHRMPNNELDDHRMKDPLLAPGERGHADGDGKSRTRSPGAGELIVEMSAHLLATVHASEGCDSPTKAAKGCTLLLAIVDLRLWHLDKATATAEELADGATVAGVDGGEGEVPLDLRPLPARTVTVKLSGGAVRRATPVAPTVAAAAEAGGDGGDVVVSAQLRGGGGALFELQWD